MCCRKRSWYLTGFETKIVRFWRIALVDFLLTYGERIKLRRVGKNSRCQGCAEGGQGWHNAQGAESLRASKILNQVASTFDNTVNLLRKGLTFEHGGAKLVSCPGRHPTNLGTPLLVVKRKKAIFQHLRVFLR